MVTSFMSTPSHTCSRNNTCLSTMPSVSQCSATVNAHSDFVNAVAWSACGKLLASGGDDCMIYIYDAQTFEVKCPLSGHSDW